MFISQIFLKHDLAHKPTHGRSPFGSSPKHDGGHPLQVQDQPFKPLQDQAQAQFMPRFEAHGGTTHQTTLGEKELHYIKSFMGNIKIPSTTPTIFDMWDATTYDT